MLQKRLWTPLFLSVLVALTLTEQQTLLPHRIIPHLLFRTGETVLSDVHPKFLEYLNRTTTDNPGWVQVYFTAQDRLDFVKRFYPAVVPLYDSLIPGAYRSDLWRYLVVLRYGGVYNDLGMRYAKRISSVIRENDEFVGAVDIDPTAIINGFFAAYPGHPVLRKTVLHVLDNIRNYRYGCDNLDITGPRAFARAYRLSFFGSPPLSPQPVQTGTFSLSCEENRSYKFHFLQFSISSSSSSSSSTPHNVWDRVQLISEVDGRVCLKNKFDGYMDAIYNKNASTHHRGAERYGVLWTERRVYRDRHDLTPLQQQQVDKLFYTNNLFKHGKALWYLHNHTRYMFPDYQTFVDMGLQECMVVAHLPPVAARFYSLLPEKTLQSSSSANTKAINDNLEAINLFSNNNFYCNSSAWRSEEDDVASLRPLIDHASLLSKIFQQSTSSGKSSLAHNTLTWPQFQALVEVEGKK